MHTSRPLYTPSSPVPVEQLGGVCISIILQRVVFLSFCFSIQVSLRSAGNYLRLQSSNRYRKKAGFHQRERLYSHPERDSVALAAFRTGGIIVRKTPNLLGLTFVLILALFVTACGVFPEPNPKTSPTLEGLARAEDYAGILLLVSQSQSNIPPYYQRSDLMYGAVAEASKDSASRENDYSTTNIQVEGVDEADIIKTDGRYLYLVANNRLLIVDAADPADLKIVAVEPFESFQETDQLITYEAPTEMYLDMENNRLTLIVSGSISEKQLPEPEETKPDPDPSAPDETELTPASKIVMDRIWYPYYNTRNYTTTRIYDIGDKTNPVIVRQFTQDGYYATSRRVGSAVYVVTNRYDYRIFAEDAKDLDPADVFPAICEDPAADTWKAIPPDRITLLPDGDPGSQLILAGIDTLDDSREADVMSVLGSSGNVYASTGFLYVAALKYIRDGKENTSPDYSTEIFRFELQDARISGSAKGSVPGSIVNQFSMDEHNGYFRIATTTGDTWTGADNPSKNNLYILDGNLDLVGQVTGLAPGETIRSVRFMGDQAYIVTFRTVDPLFSIDLSNPLLPVVRGELKIPGYSTYLHPYDENLLIGFGYDVFVEKESAFNLGIKVSLFDISDYDKPLEISSIVFGGAGSYADILYNHKSLLFSKNKNVIAFPATLTQKSAANPREYTQPVFQGLLVLGIDDNRQITLRGHVSHFDKFSDPFGTQKELTDKEWNAFYSYDAIYRAAYIGDTLFTFSGRQLRTTDLNSFDELGAVELPGYDETSGGSYYRDMGVMR